MEWQSCITKYTLSYRAISFIYSFIEQKKHETIFFSRKTPTFAAGFGVTFYIHRKW